jgi:hypothetical protein
MWKIFIVVLMVGFLLESVALIQQQKHINQLIERVVEQDIMQTLVGDWILHLNEQLHGRDNRI